MKPADPIFLAGADRSGTGLLGEILESHPDLAISRRTNYWRRYYRRFGDLAVHANLERCVEEMLRAPRIARLIVDPFALLDDVRDGEPTYGRLFAAVQRQHLQQTGKRRWGDKSLNAEGHADVIFREFPDARMIHVLRDPRDRYASQATHRQASRGKAGAGADLWLWSAQQARRNSKRYSERYLIVRYEDLVARPHEAIDEVCAFIGEHRAAEMLPLPAGAPAAPGAPPWPRPVTSESIGRYRRDLTTRETAFIEGVTGVSMARFGYAPTDAALHPHIRVLTAAVSDPLRLAALCAARTQRMLAARTTWSAIRPLARRGEDGSVPPGPHSPTVG
jgi:hypothetical protein